MTHDATSLFAELVRDLCEVLLVGQELSLEERVFAVYRGLGLVVASAGSLPVLAGPVPPLGPPRLLDWPGLGSFEDYWRESDDGPLPMKVSQTLEVVFQQLHAGLEAWEEGRAERAVGLWGAGFDGVWGPAALEVLTRLQPAVAGYRRDRLRAEQKACRGPASLVMVAGGRSRSPVSDDDRATLGLRVQAVPGGLIVLAVHPRGPAAGRLQPGDALLAVEGHALDGLTEEEAGPALAGPLGSERRLEVYRDGATATVVVRSVALRSLMEDGG